MMENPNYDWSRISDTAIASRVAMYIKDNRLKQNKTQAELATEAGIARRTISAFESGEKNINIITLIQLLRALNCLHVLNEFKITMQISPLAMAKMEQQKRERAHSISKTPKPRKSDW